MFVQLLKAYGLTEQSLVVSADAGSCGTMIESTQRVLWDLANQFPIREELCVDLHGFYDSPLPVRMCKVLLRLCASIEVCVHVHSSSYVLVTFSAGSQCVLLL